MPGNPDVLVRKLGRSPFAAYGTRAYVEAHPRSRTDARWQDCAWVGFDAKHRYFSTSCRMGMTSWLSTDKASSSGTFAESPELALDLRA